MKPNLTIFLFAFLSFVIAVNPVLAHTPLEPGDNESLETAMVVRDPTKSWAIYAELHEAGEAQYYRLDLNQGERLYAMLYIPLEEEGFAPNLAVMGPGLPSFSEGDLPEYVEVPSGAGVMIVKANASAKPGYEPFTPSSYYYLAKADLEVSELGEYYLAVYEPSRGGRYGLAVGYREEFTLDEWLLVPIDVISIHQWEGQSLAFIIAPMIATVAIGLLALTFQKKDSIRTLMFWTGSSAGLLYIGSGITMFAQMFIALSSAGLDASAVLTVVFALIPVLLGIGLLRLTLKDILTSRTRVLTASLGIVGLFTWAGLLLGPSLAVLTSILPGAKTSR